MKILEYLEGDLNDLQETQLFKELASDKVMRSDFKQQLQINAAVHSDTMAFVPKANTTMNLFSTLGITGAAGVIATGIQAGAPVSSTTGFWIANKVAILSSTIASVIAVAVTLFFINPWVGGVYNNSNDTSSEYSNNLNNKTVPLFFAISDDEENNVTKDQHEPTQETKIVYKYIYRDKPQEEFKNDKINKVETKTIYKIDKASFVDNNGITEFIMNETNSKSYANNLQTNDDFSRLSDGGKSSFMPNLSGNNDFTIEAGFSSYVNNQSTNIHPNEYQNFNNMNIALFYNYSSNIAIGIDYRRENFYQKFTGTLLSKTYLYEQQPNFQILTANFRYKPKFMRIGFVNPFVEIAAGIPLIHSGAGIIMRPLIIGAEIRPFANFAIIADIDYSIFRYSHQNIFFNSDKFGFHFRAAWSL